MGVIIHDDFWAAAKAMPEKQRPGFLYALCAYSFDGEEPVGSPPWLPTFLVVKDRLDMGSKASERGRAMARARWDKRQDAQADAKSLPKQDAQADAGADAQAYAHAHARASETRDAEDEVEVEYEVEKNNTPQPPKPRRGGAKGFTPPSVAEVDAYIAEKGYGDVLTGDEFCGYYESQGWRKANGLPLTTWRGAVSNWAVREKRKREQADGGKGAGQDGFSAYA